MKYLFLIFTFSVIISCGGSGTSSSSPSASDPAPTIIGLQGDLNAIEPIDLD